MRKSTDATLLASKSLELRSLADDVQDVVAALTQTRGNAALSTIGLFSLALSQVRDRLRIIADEIATADAAQPDEEPTAPVRPAPPALRVTAPSPGGARPVDLRWRRESNGVYREAATTCYRGHEMIVARRKVGGAWEFGMTNLGQSCAYCKPCGQFYEVQIDADIRNLFTDATR